MKRIVLALTLFALFIGATVGAALASVRMVSRLAEDINGQKTALVQGRLDETLELLETLSTHSYICDDSVSFKEKAAFLTDKNRSEGLGYFMMRILDEDINIYREDRGASSNLGSREYMQQLYATGETQVTDAFLAGADGETLNYTVTVAIKKEGRVTAAIMASIYGSEIDEMLMDESGENVLVGSLLQYMGGVSTEQYGMSVGQALESEIKTSRPVENILLDFKERRSGSFWGFGEGIDYFIYTPVKSCDWVVMTKVEVIPIVKNILIVYITFVVLISAVGIILLRKKKPSVEEIPDSGI